LATALEGVELKIAVKAGTSGKIFGSVNNIIIATAIKEQKNLDIDRKLIHLNEDHIKEIGAHEAVVKLHKDVEITIKLDVVAE
jgi:large subunit ribosomal protein L9